jgi:hypothetical protein
MAQIIGWEVLIKRQKETGNGLQGKTGHLIGGAYPSHLVDQKMN